VPRGGRRPGAGRPVRGLTRRQSITWRLPADLLERIQKSAEQDGSSVSGWVEEALARAVAHQESSRADGVKRASAEVSAPHREARHGGHQRPGPAAATPAAERPSRGAEDAAKVERRILSLSNEERVRAVLSVPCGRCHAAPEHPCDRPGSSEPHQARWESISLRVDCTSCGAPAGRRCRGSDDGGRIRRPVAGSHMNRIDAGCADWVDNLSPARRRSARRLSTGQ
jgi:hypothetical protein